MLHLAITSVRFRTAAFVAAFASMLLGSVIIMTFSSLIDISLGNDLSARDEENLITMAAVVGACGLIIVVFSVATTMTLTVRQRTTDIALLKSVGATPAQVRRMITGEAVILAIIASLIAIPLSILAGNILMRNLVSAGLVATGTPYEFGIVALAMGAGVTVLASVAAAWLTARRTAEMGVAQSLLRASREISGSGRARYIAGWIFVICGISAAVATAAVLEDAEISIIQLVAGEASLLTAIGLGLLAPGLIATISAVISRGIQPLLGVTGYLSALNVRERPHQMAGHLIPIILLTAVATGTLYVQRIDSSIANAGGPTSSDAEGVQALNYTVVGMLCIFAAIMLVNSLIAATMYRRNEFAQYRLLGLTQSQVIRLVAAEEISIIVTGLATGSCAGLLTIVPYSIARTGSVMPDVGPAIYLGIVALVVLLTFGASLGAAHRSMRHAAAQQIPA